MALATGRFKRLKALWHALTVGEVKITYTGHGRASVTYPQGGEYPETLMRIEVFCEEQWRHRLLDGKECEGRLWIAKGEMFVRLPDGYRHIGGFSRAFPQATSASHTVTLMSRYMARSTPELPKDVDVEGNAKLEVLS